MNTYLTEHAAHPLGRWLATLAISLVLLALAYAQAPDPAGPLGLSSRGARTLANSRPAPDGPRRPPLAPNQAPALASTQLSPPTGTAPRAR